MIASIDKLRQFISTDERDQALTERLSGLEALIRSYTHNDFRDRYRRLSCDIVDGKIILDAPWLAVDDTIQITQSKWNNGLYVITGIDNGEVTVGDTLLNEINVLVSRIKYPNDIVMGAINALKWQLENADKAGISSETISRHSVSYENSNGSDSIGGFPRSVMAFLEPYRKARF